jgi:hypothetical protein
MRYRAGTAEERWCTERTAWTGLDSRNWPSGPVAVLPSARIAFMFAVIASSVIGGTACGGSARDDESRQSQPAGTGATAGEHSQPGGTAATSIGAAGTKPICPATGVWQMCNVIERLDRAGLAPRREEGLVREPPLSSPGVAIMLGRSELRVFVYADRAARERDQARLDRKKYVSPNDPLSIEAEPTLIASENLLAILRSRSDHQRERVSDALTAGPPQSPGTKG